MSGQMIVVAGIFAASVGTTVGLGLFVLTTVLRMRQTHRQRLARVGRKRLSGRLDFEDARLVLLRQKQDTNLVVTLTDAAARILPLLDTARLHAGFRRAGLAWSVSTFVGLSLLVAALLTAVLSVSLAAPTYLWLLPSLVAGMLSVDRFVAMRGRMRSNRFMKQLPDAIDTIVRGIRSGLPVSECIASVGQESGDPIGGHFQAVSERVSLGEPLETALWRVARVVDRPEMDFFAISIAIQAETGGSLAEALGNLAELLRARERMKLKIRAISSEARASAMIIGALPFLMLGLLVMMSPDYVIPLFTDPRGHMMLAAGLGSIAAGAFVMWRMTQFEI